MTRASLWLSALTAAWSAVLAMAGGGIDATIAGVSITANDPFRPLLGASILLTIYILSGGSLAPPAWLLSIVSRLKSASWPLPGTRGLAWMLAGSMTVVIWFYGTKAAGGADSYGYLSQSELWAQGSIGALKVRQPIVAEVPWPDASWTFAPAGSYRPMHVFRDVEGEDRWSMVPVYPPGLPMLLALFGAIGGFQAKYLIFPLLGGLLILATYGIGVRLASPAAALMGAWLLATTPAFLFMIVSPMSDAPVSGLLAAAFFLALGTGPWSAAGAGIMISLALLMRPNLAPVAGLFGLLYVFRLRDGAARLAAVRDGAIYGLLVAIGAGTLAIINQSNYGSPLASGYGDLGPLFSVTHIPENLRLYLTWLAETQTPIALVGLAVALVPIRRLWPAADWGALVVMSLSVAAIWATYLVYKPWDVWWYLRFLLPSSPFIMLGVGAVFALIYYTRDRFMQVLAVTAVVILGVVQVRAAADRSAFQLWSGERRYVAGARMTNFETKRNSLIFSGIHVGSVRYYGSRMSANFEGISPRWLDRSVAWLNRRGVHSYLLVEEWEVPIFLERFHDQQTINVFTGPPLAMLEHPGRLLLYDLLEAQPVSARPSLWTGVDEGIWAAPKAPEPRLVLEP